MNWTDLNMSTQLWCVCWSCASASQIFVLFSSSETSALFVLKTCIPMQLFILEFCSGLMLWTSHNTLIEIYFTNAGQEMRRNARKHTNYNLLALTLPWNGCEIGNSIYEKIWKLELYSFWRAYLLIYAIQWPNPLIFNAPCYACAVY